MGRVLCILIIDDEEIVHDTLGEYLSECGHRVAHSFDGTKALSVLRETRYDVAFIDVRMPGIDGTELFGEIQTLHPGMPVVMITGHGNVDMAEQVLQMGATAFLLKPIRLIELDDIIDRIRDGADCFQEGVDRW